MISIAINRLSVCRARGDLAHSAGAERTDDLQARRVPVGGTPPTRT
jgi:hypothetical protein